MADHVEVTDAKFNKGLLTVNLVREIPEAMKPKAISINGVKALRDVNQTHDNESSEEKAA